jgi:hypothetical protein
MHAIHDSIIQFLIKKNIRVFKNIVWAKGVSQINSILKSIHNYDLQTKSNVLTVIFIVDDHCGPIVSYKNQIILRTSAYRSRLLQNEFILPYLWECSPMPFLPYPKTQFPVVSFCGLASRYRMPLIEKINKHPNIKGSFILRQQFWGGNPHEKNIVNEFNNNIKNSHFVICSRGNGNFSMRFYQTLAFGRIPLLLNTDMKLPFDKYIDYNDLIIVGNTEDEIIAKLLHCWKNRDIIAMQQKCASVFKDFFTSEGFALNLYNEIIRGDPSQSDNTAPA